MHRILESLNRDVSLYITGRHSSHISEDLLSGNQPISQYEADIHIKHLKLKSLYYPYNVILLSGRFEPFLERNYDVLQKRTTTQAHVVFYSWRKTIHFNNIPSNTQYTWSSLDQRQQQKQKLRNAESGAPSKTHRIRIRLLTSPSGNM